MESKGAKISSTNISQTITYFLRNFCVEISFSCSFALEFWVDLLISFLTQLNIRIRNVIVTGFSQLQTIKPFSPSLTRQWVTSYDIHSAGQEDNSSLFLCPHREMNVAGNSCSFCLIWFYCYWHDAIIIASFVPVSFDEKFFLHHPVSWLSLHKSFNWKISLTPTTFPDYFRPLICIW